MLLRLSTMLCRSAPLLALLAAPALLMAPQSADAQLAGAEQRIAAIVNDEVISVFDVEQRMRLIVASSGARPTGADLERLGDQVLRTLVDEKLQVQEALRLDLEIDEQDIIDQLTFIAERNNSTVEDIQRQLASDGISIFTLTDQIKSDLLWQKLVRGRFGAQVKISEEEIDRVLNDIKSNLDKPQYNVVEIFLPVDSPAEDAKVLELARTLVKRMQEGTAFSEIAGQYSQAPTAASGGELGWVTRGTLPEELDAWLANSRRGMLTVEPLRTISGYYLLGVRDTRNVASGITGPDTPIEVRRVVAPLNAFDSVEKAERAKAGLQRFARALKSCDGLEGAARAAGLRVVNLGSTTVMRLPPRDQQRVVGLVPVEASGVADRTNEGWDVVVLCSVVEQRTPGLPSRDEIADRLFQQQISLLSRRYLRDLRRDAVVEIRMGER